ncbi:hypothetical protein C8R30_1378 [Nitrosomonas nitrosa]|uniref:hypothetical protein n=1 Tax=Nitrosomonas nitrosa TaxID=52442 RepID=UPI000D4EA1DB|nr:hypothetical protein [Nitrosomonas nitrosa]PTQ90240.1 hypothetical protein C8R30_1378 [Nitrosomonas nitrosa]
MYLTRLPRSEDKKLDDALTAIEQYDVWGFYEEMPTFLTNVGALIGMPAPEQIERVNVTNSRPAVKQISPELHKHLAVLNALDLEFYRVLRERWRKERNHKPTITLPKFSPWVPYNQVYPVEDATGTLTTDGTLGNVATNEVFNLPLLLKNASGEPWVSTEFHPINLSYHWLDQTGNIVVFDGRRSPLPAREVLPGQTLTAQMKVMAPDVPGLYRLMLLPVQEKHCWFDKCGFTPGMLELEVVASGAARYFPAADLRLLSQVGKREESSIISTGREGFLLFGPYLRLPAGQYVARLEGSCELGTPGIWLDVSCDQAKRVLVRQDIIENAKPGLIAEQFFELAEMVNDLEVRLWVTANALVHIEALRIEPSISNIKATELPEIIEVSEISPASSTLQ